MKDSRNTKSEDGFTLIEVLIALSIFAIGLLALANMQILALRGNSTSQRVTTATALAEGAMEWLQSLPADDAIFNANANDQPVTNAPFDANGRLTLQGGGTMTVTYDINTNPSFGGNPFPGSTVLITVNVAHTASSAQDITLTSVKWVR